MFETRFGTVTRLAAALVGLTLCARAQDFAGTFLLEGAQETPPVVTPATGVATVTLDTTTNVFTWFVTFSGLTSTQTGSHFHGPAPPGTPAGIQIPFSTGSPSMGSTVLTPGQEADVLAGLWYVNIHTLTNGGGEIRGQVIVTPTEPSLCNGDSGNGLGCTDCPCANNAPLGTIGGCLNSAATSTRLFAWGDTSVSLPPSSISDLRFSATGAPPFTFCVLSSGDAVAPQSTANPCFGLDSGVQSVLFDGLRCVVQVTRRHGGRAANGLGEVGTTTSPWGGEGGPPIGIAASGTFVAGQTRYFQAAYRDLMFGTCTAGVNTTQALEVTFTP